VLKQDSIFDAWSKQKLNFAQCRNRTLFSTRRRKKNQFLLSVETGLYFRPGAETKIKFCSVLKQDSIFDQVSKQKSNFALCRNRTQFSTRRRNKNQILLSVETGLFSTRRRNKNKFYSVSKQDSIFDQASKQN
jgi:hypothetical protein